MKVPEVLALEILHEAITEFPVYYGCAPRVPSAAEMKELLIKARDRLADTQIWVNPDCGLKTRKWEEVRPSLINMVEAARELR